MAALVRCTACGWTRRYRSPQAAHRQAAAHQCQPWTPAQVEELVERSRKAQGLPAKVTDPLVLRQAATLLGAGTTKAPPAQV